MPNAPVVTDRQYFNPDFGRRAARLPFTATGRRQPDQHRRRPQDLRARPYHCLRADPPAGLPRSRPGVRALLPVVGNVRRASRQAGNVMLLLARRLALLPLVALVPDRPPPAAFGPGRLHRDPALQFDDLAAAPAGRAPVPAREYPGASRTAALPHPSNRLHSTRGSASGQASRSQPSSHTLQSRLP
jgi:hypothetical protein